jgi:hypothetical protein
MSGLRPVAAFFIILTAISWIMVAISVAKTTSAPLDMQSYADVPEAGMSAAGDLGMSTASLDRLLATSVIPVGNAR